MAFGVRSWDASGNLEFDSSNSLGRVLGVATLTGGTAGSQSNSKLANGTPFWIVTCTTAPFVRQPTVTTTSSAISWTWPAGSGTATYKLVYGVY